MLVLGSLRVTQSHGGLKGDIGVQPPTAGAFNPARGGAV